MAAPDPVWRRPPPIPLDLNGPTDRPYAALPPDFAEQPLLQALRRVVARQPDAIAVADESGRASYAELLRRVLRAARRIDASAPGAVAALVPETVDGVAAMLGCLVAGRITILLDPQQPRERIAAILHDARPAVVLAADEEVDAAGAQRIALSALYDGPDDPGWEPTKTLDPDEPAAVFYTSGSTGQPKGVVVSMWSCLYRASQSIESWHLGPNDRTLCIAQPGTRPSMANCLATLLSGARLVQYGAAAGLGALRDRLQREAVTVLIGGPSLLRTILALPAFGLPLATLRMLRAGGAALSQADVAAARAILPADCLISHAYSSTEASTIAYWIVPPDYPASEPRLAAGYPGADLEFALLDADGDASGELVVRGRGIALGEWQGGRCLPGRMQPVPERPGWRAFRTGDVVRLEADGLLRVLGRADQQVKINGVRVEPAEVEAALRRVDAVTDAVVITRILDDRPTLLAYVAGTRPAERLRRALQTQLRAKLPPSMRPSHIVVLDRLPRLPSGKLDYRALPDPHARGWLRRILSPPS